MLEVLSLTHARHLHFRCEVLAVAQMRSTIVNFGCLVRSAVDRLLEVCRVPALTGLAYRSGVELRHGLSHDGLISQREVFHCMLFHSLNKMACLTGQKAV